MMKASASYSTTSSSLAKRGPTAIGARVAVDLLHLGDLAAHQRPARRLVAEQGDDLGLSFALVGQFAADDQDLEARQPVDLEFEDRVGLLGVEAEGRDDLGGRVGLAIRLADDLEDPIERVEDLLEAFEDVDTPGNRRGLVFEAAVHDLHAEVQEVPQHRLQIEAFGPADVLLLGRNQTGEVDAEAHLERRVPAQVRHDERLVGVPLDLEFDADVVGAHVAHVEQRRQLARDHQVGDARDQLRLVDRVRDGGDRDHLAGAPDLTLLPRAAQANRAAAGAIDLLQLVGRVENLAAGGEVRALDVLAQLQRRQLGVVDQPQQRRADLAEMVRRDVGGHADRDAHRAVDQERRDARGQHDRLGARAVVVRTERAPCPDRVPTAVRR